jgi:hypothetical protein
MRINIPPVGRIHNLKLTITGGSAGAGKLCTLADMKKYIGQMMFKLDNEVVRSWTLAEYLAAIEVNGFINKAGMLSYYFSEPWRAAVADEEILAIAVGGRYADVALELDVTQPVSTEQNPVAPLQFLVAYEYDLLTKNDIDGNPIKLMMGQKRQQQAVGAGQPEIIFDPLEGDLSRFHIITPSTVKPTRIRVLQGETVFFDRYNTPAAPEIEQQLRDMGMVIPADYTDAFGTWKVTPVVFDHTQQIRTAIGRGALTGMRVQMDLPSAADIRLLFEIQLRR